MRTYVSNNIQRGEPKMIRKVIIIAVIAVTILLSLFGKDIYYNSMDNKHWKQFKSIIKEDKIYKIILNTGSPIELEGSERSNFIQSLNKSNFYKSNWLREGPTGPVITIIFKDGSRQHLQYWGGTIFETYYKNGQFLIKNVEVEQILREHNINLN